MPDKLGSRFGGVALPPIVAVERVAEFSAPVLVSERDEATGADHFPGTLQHNCPDHGFGFAAGLFGAKEKRVCVLDCFVSDEAKVLCDFGIGGVFEDIGGVASLELAEEQTPGAERDDFPGRLRLSFGFCGAHKRLISEAT